MPTPPQSSTARARMGTRQPPPEPQPRRRFTLQFACEQLGERATPGHVSATPSKTALYLAHIKGAPFCGSQAPVAFPKSARKKTRGGETEGGARDAPFKPAMTAAISAAHESRGSTVSHSNIRGHSLKARAQWVAVEFMSHALRAEAALRAEPTRLGAATTSASAAATTGGIEGPNATM